MHEVTLSNKVLRRIERATHGRISSVERNVDRFAQPGERKTVGERIDPESAFVFFIYTQTFDPYRDLDPFPEELDCIGREYFAVDPIERIAVLLSDLPEQTQKQLEPKRHAAYLEGWRQIFEISAGP